MLYTGARINGDEAANIGLVDHLVPLDDLRSEAIDFASEIATSAPLAVESIRQTMRGHLPQAVKAATAREKEEQDRLSGTEDWKEGVAAMNERRVPNFSRKRARADKLVSIRE